ncbi:MAG: aminotransferase class I/II-fold pyridoxal phosphate-dependent enzyme [Nitrososphaerota archaeon]|nr:aminotransferase class I/II-fold pyridoxal phosphate-dependent enzyme [Candidatus Bathyarchaeota archaeon]MDW8023473.1 aminotransferase class I/II-fold pyridoxal phosphate-dependent enzyme [Nitrososphaerota archaeon]
MDFVLSNRVRALPPYLFAELEKMVRQKRRAGADIISLSIGDPDLPPPKIVLDALKEEVAKPENHGYSSSEGEYEFRSAVSDWYKKRFNVDLDPDREIVALIGSKEGLCNIARAFLNEGDRALLPDPGYPAYAYGCTILNGGVPIYFPLREDNDFLPNLDDVSVDGAKMMFINYPNNPTGAVISLEELKMLVDFAVENRIILCYDNAYSEITFSGYQAPSVLQIDKAREVAVEFHSCSKTFSMAGSRIGFAVGNERLIAGLKKVKAQVDSGPPKYIQLAAAKALRTYAMENPPKFVREACQTYYRRVNILVEELNAMGLKCQMPKATFYVWAKCGTSSIDFAKKMLEVDVVATPGIGFGSQGEGYIRFSATCPEERIKEACERLRKIL